MHWTVNCSDSHSHWFGLPCHISEITLACNSKSHNKIVSFIEIVCMQYMILRIREAWGVLFLLNVMLMLREDPQPDIQANSQSKGLNFFWN